jgi:hypothetical protein
VVFGASAQFDVRFEQAIQWFQHRAPMLRDANFAALSQHAHQQAFTIAGITQISLVNDVWQALDKALMDGTDFKQFKQDIGAKLEAAWGGPKPARLETIWRTTGRSPAPPCSPLAPSGCSMRCSTFARRQSVNP